MRVEAELGLALPVLGREGPGGDVNLGRPAIDGVGQVLLLGQLGVEVVDVGGAGDPGGHDHGALEAGGGNGVVEEVLQVDAGDEEEIGLGQRPRLLRGHVVLVGGGVGGEQAGQGQVRLGTGGVGAEVLGRAVGAGAVEGQAVVLAVGGELGDVVADLSGGRDRLDGGVVSARCGGSAGGQGQCRGNEDEGGEDGRRPAPADEHGSHEG